jgi:tetratricopeptide (TPR) repeat protein
MPDRIDDLRRRVEADPTSIAFAALAEEYRRLGRFQEAVDVCRRGLERHPAYLSAKVTLARALIELKQLDEAQRTLDDVLRMAPENLAAIRARADLHQRRGSVPEAFDLEAARAVFEGTAAADTSPVPVQPVQESRVEAPPPSSPELERLEVFLQAIVAERSRRGAPGA